MMPPLPFGVPTLASGLGVAFAVSLLLTPLVRMIALRVVPTDFPSQDSDSSSIDEGSPRDRGTPSLGGLSVVLAVGLTLALFDGRMSALLISAGCAAVAGLVDDVRPLSPMAKTGLLACAASAAWILGLRLGLLPGLWDVALTVVVLIWVAHATNVLDMADGLLGGQGVVICGGMFVVGWLAGLPVLLFPALALAGALAGFLIHNWHPARIYLGDTGSLFVGIFLGGMAVMCVNSFSGPTRIVLPVLLLAMPTFEAVFLIVLRTAKGRVPWRPSGDHPEQRLRKMGTGVRGAVVRLCLVGVASSFAAAACLFLSDPMVVVLGVGALAALALMGVGLSRIDVEGDGIDGRPQSILSKNWLVHRLMHRAMAGEKDGVHGRLLDIGCGRRPYFRLFEDRVSDYVGIERDVDRYVEEPPDVQGDGNALPFASTAFDTVISNQVLEHVPEPAYAVGEMARVMRPGARAIITAPHIWGIHEEPHDYYRFTPFGLTYIAQRAGLSVERVMPLGGYWITAGARFCYYLEHFARGPFRLPVAVTWGVVQCVVVWLDGLHRVEGDAWNHLLVARKPEE